ncbi:hypothetical protein E4U45_000275, partial [Claviceps purpurea]
MASGRYRVPLPLPLPLHRNPRPSPSPSRPFAPNYHGKKRPSRSSGLRTHQSQLWDCPFRVQASCKARLNNKWEYNVVSKHEAHNHEPSRDALAHPVHRHRTEAQNEAIRELSALPGIDTCEIAGRLKLQYPEALATGRDIENQRQIARRRRRDAYREPPVKVPAKRKPQPGTPEDVFEQYERARNEWYEKERLPGVPKTNEAY